MIFSRSLAATSMAAAFAMAGFWAFFQDRLVLSGTLFVLCSFSIYLREKSLQADE